MHIFIYIFSFRSILLVLFETQLQKYRTESCLFPAMQLSQDFEPVLEKKINLESILFCSISNLEFHFAAKWKQRDKAQSCVFQVQMHLSHIP